MTLDELIEKAAVEYTNLDDLTSAVLRQASKAMLWPAVRHYVSTRQRVASLRVEREEFDPKRHVPTLSFAQSYVNVPSNNGTGTYRAVTWDEMTIADHEAKIAHYQKLISGNQAAIKRHRWAIEACQKAGVDRLVDIDRAVA